MYENSIPMEYLNLSEEIQEDEFENNNDEEDIYHQGNLIWYDDDDSSSFISSPSFSELSYEENDDDNDDNDVSRSNDHIVDCGFVLMNQILQDLRDLRRMTMILQDGNFS